MSNPHAKHENRQPDAEVEKLYESCCGSCGSPSPTTTGLTLDILTPVPQGAESGPKR